MLMLHAHVSVGDSGYSAGRKAEGFLHRSTDSSVEPVELKSYRGCMTSRLEENLD